MNETPERSNDNFFQMKRTHNNVFVSTPRTGFIFGGQSTRMTTNEPEGTALGYLAFDFESKTWSHEETGPYSPNGGIFGGGAVFAPSFGPNGLVFVFGGVGSLDGNSPFRRADNYLDFSTIHFMDPVTRKWYSQETTGSPTARLDFCFGGVEVPGSDGSSFDM